MKKGKVLIVDDSEMNRAILADMLSDDYETLEAEDGLQAVALLQKSVDIDLVLLDIVMPRMGGFEVLEIMKRNRWIEDIPVIIISAENSATQVERAYDLGVSDFITRPFDALIVRRRVVNTLFLYSKQKRLISMVEEQIQEREHHNDLMINILSHIVEFRNGESGQHIFHVRALTDLLLRALAAKTDQYQLNEEKIGYISTGSALHDVGKIAIADHILNKPGKLTAEEFETMKKHTTIGANMLKDIKMYQGDPMVNTAEEICRWHHERYDGRGYPDGLTGDEIPISAQVVSIADVYDALISPRVYKKAIPHEKALQMILDGECGVFNPLLLECLTENAQEIRRMLEEDQEDSFGHQTVSHMAWDALRSERGGISDRTLRLLDYERMKNGFFASMTEAIQFEYNDSPPMLTVSAWDAQKLGIDEIVMDPAHDEKVQYLLGENTWKEIAGKLRATSRENPEIRADYPMRNGDSFRWHRIIARALWSDDPKPQFEGVLGTIMDIHETHSKMQELEHKASRDPLTGLMNRASAKEQIEARMQDRPNSHYALAIFDLDYFKSANDNFGHQFGDKVLEHVAKCLCGSIRGSDISGRVGGDEFLLFLEYNTDIERTIDRIFHSLCVDYEDFRISVTMGVALGEQMGLSYEELFRAADAALYAAKRAGRGRYRFYDESLKDMLGTTPNTEPEPGTAAE